MARVFQLKKKAIIDYIYKHGIFGRAVAYVYTIEFQKRGLPHMHILIILAEGDRILSTDAIDTCIRAYWPNPETEPKLFETVKRCMVHGPCGPANPNAPCMDKETRRCMKGYPKPFSEFTTMDENGFPLYKRPDDNRSYLVGNIWVDNRWIVPYNPLMSALFDCHINLEAVASGSSFKYLFKYIQKGGDMASLEVHDQDEITKYVSGRYISASEAAHRIFHFDMHDQTPNVVRLQVHLPGQHMVVFDQNEDPATVRERAAREQTTLTQFFLANANEGALGEEARKHTYADFPQHFTWKETNRQRQWEIRKRGFAIGRMYFVPPTAGERFYLRTLLTVVKGPTSFEDLCTFEHIVYPTFRDACLARGLLEDDGEWRKCLQEACEMQTGWRLRRLFATILIFCEPLRPEELWAEFRQYMCDDLARRMAGMVGLRDVTPDDIYDYGLYLLQEVLRNEGRSLADWPSMPRPRCDWANQRENTLITEQLNFDVNEQRRLWEERLPQLNTGQRLAYDDIIASVDGQAGSLFFISGPGGTGKTFLYTVICNKLRSEGLIVLCVASSGIAALLLPGGRTPHSVFKIPIDGLDADSVCSISKNSLRADLLRRARVVIWDEVGAQHRHAIEAVDRTLQDIRDNEQPFGGMTVIFGGDFQQTLPVIPNGAREEIVEATIRKSALWSSIRVHHLRENMRLRLDPNSRDFSNWLLDVGHGRNCDERGMVHIPDAMRVTSYGALTDFIYAGVEVNPPPPPTFFLDRMILAPRNVDVADVNHEILERMAGDATSYYSIDEIIQDHHESDPRNAIPLEFLRSLNLNTLPPGELKLKKGCPIILLRNLSSAQGLCNGTRLIVTQMSSRVIEARIIGGDHDGEIALIPRISLIPQERSSEVPFRIKRRQFPVRLAFALTINKAQGQSVKWVGLDLRVPVFGHGQLYVALSRATSCQRIRVLTSNEGSDSDILNIVYPEVLLD